MPSNSVRVSVIGATGYTGAELLRILARHPKVELLHVAARSSAGARVGDIFPHLHGLVEHRLCPPDIGLLSEAEVVFCATPNGTAMTLAPRLLAAGVRIVDLSADFRLADGALWERWYGQPHAAPELLAEAVYGLPEVNREAIRGARLVANPGCYPTAVQLGFLPLLERGVADPGSLIADAKSGVSGAGRKAELATGFCEVADSLKAYSVPGHRHLPEIRQGLERVARTPVGLTFVPHLVPMMRGIHATLYARLREHEVDLQALFESRYASEPFVDVLPAGSHPATRDVRGANLCRLACHRPQGGDTAVVLAVEDNLVKGAAGQAVQNMNLMFGYPEEWGLERAGRAP